MIENALPHVVILGAGFGGLRAARLLARQPVRVTLVDRNNYHLFQPLLYQVATAGISPDEIAYPVRAILRRQKNLEFRMTEARRVNLVEKNLETSTGTIAYDALILAAGGQTNFYGLESIARHGFGLKTLGDATAIRNHVLSCFERATQEADATIRRALLTFVVVGGGPTGVECAGAISELIRLVLSKDYPTFNIKEARILLLEAADRLVTHLPASLGEETARSLWQKQVEVRFGAAVEDFDGQQIRLKGGEIIPTHTVIWGAGVRAADIMDTLGTTQGAQRRVAVQPTLQLEQHPEVFVIGDAALLAGEDGRPLPMVAPVAMQQADTAAANLMQLLKGGELQPFRYQDPGAMATIGRNQAVARLGRLEFHGFIAWLIWLVVHLMQLVGFRNRLVVLINWTWDYLFYDRSVRLIEGERCQE
ncbi:MAG TPA: NAD(P)/FAD-dependent oxidoreductase [Anaerolineaceae bacterium]|nr:NAD(P)/FAD-dependent oxidoreductase [Anaerolineaceae bacterium]